MDAPEDSQRPEDSQMTLSPRPEAPPAAGGDRAGEGATAEDSQVQLDTLEGSEGPEAPPAAGGDRAGGGATAEESQMQLDTPEGSEGPEAPPAAGGDRAGGGATAEDSQRPEAPLAAGGDHAGRGANKMPRSRSPHRAPAAAGGDRPGPEAGGDRPGPKAGGDRPGPEAGPEGGPRPEAGGDRPGLEAGGDRPGPQAGGDRLELPGPEGRAWLEGGGRREEEGGGWWRLETAAGAWLQTAGGRATLREHGPVDLDDEEGWAAMWGFDYEGCEPGHFRLVNRWLPHLYLNRVLDWWRVKGFRVRADWLSAQWRTRPTASGSGLVFLNRWKPEALVAERGRVSTGPAPPEADPPTEFVWRLVQVA